jgi:hypothetical protein
MPRSTNEIIQGNIRLLRHQRGTPGSKEYIYNQEKITKAPDKEFRLDYVDIDALADPTKFDPKLASNMYSFSASITNMVTHIKQYDLTAPIMVPVELDHINTTVSDEKYNLLTDYPRFGRDDIAVWTVFYKMHPVDSTDSDTDNLLQDYIFKCLTGRLRTEVTEEFYELPDDEQGAPSLIYMALTKLHSHSRACVQTLQGSITNFRLSEIANEDVSLACSFLKSIAKHLQGRRWPQAKLASSTSRNDSAFVAAPAPSPASKSSTVQRLIDSVPTEDLLALLLD